METNHNQQKINLFGDYRRLTMYHHVQLETKLPRFYIRW